MADNFTDTVRRAAEGRAREILAKLGIPERYLVNRHMECPACGGVDRFRYDDRHRRGDFFCNQCGAGDLFDLLMRTHGWAFPETLDRVADTLGIQRAQHLARRKELWEGRKKSENQVAQVEPPEIGYQKPPEQEKGFAFETSKSTGLSKPSINRDLSRAEKIPEDVRQKRRDKRRRAFRIWRETVPIQGTLAETYIHNRGLSLPPDCEALRFHPACPIFGEHHPAMVGLFRSAKTGLPWAIHITPLTPGGWRIERLGKPTLGGSRGCIIKISPDDAVTTGIGLTEGIETALAVLQAGWAPVWAAGNTSLMGSFPVLGGIEALSIFADHDSHEAGVKAARKAAERWAAAGRETTIMKPRKVGSDWADLIEKGAA